MANILIIDDNKGNLLSLKALMSELFGGFGIETATSGAEGIELAKTHHPDVIFLDILMPGMDGFEVCETLKEEDDLRDIPVVFVTALREDSAKKVRALEVGAEGFLSKPVNKNELVAQMKAMLKIKSANDYKKSEKKRLEKLVAKRTKELREELRLNREMSRKLSETEEKFRTIAEQLPELVSLTDEAGIITYASPASMTLFGISPLEMVGKRFTTFVDEASIPKAVAAFGGTVQKGSNAKYLELRMKRGDGSVFDGELCGDRYESDFGRGTLVTIRDITERKRAEEVLRESEEKFRSYIEYAPEGVFITNENGRYLEVNSSACKITGYSEAELLKLSIPDLLLPEDLENGMQHFKTVKEKGFARSESGFVTKSGEKHVWIVSAVKLSDTRFLGFVQDITERKRAEEKRRKSEEQFRDLFENATVGIYRSTYDGKILMANPALVKMLGFDSFGELAQRDLSNSKMDANFRREQFISDINAYKEVKALESEWKRKDGTPVIVSESARDVCDNMGNHLYYEGFVIDITEKRKAEEKLKLLNRSVEASSVSIMITDAEGNIMYTNPFFSSLTGYSFEEVVGKTPRILKSGFQQDEFYKDLWSTILSGRDWTGELLNKKKNGELYWIKSVISPIQNPDGVVTNFVAIREDITERKSMLEDLMAAKIKAEESDRLKLAFLANMSHEIRTPMNGILGFLELIREPDIDEGEKALYISIVKKSAQRLLSTITDIIEISKIESGIIQITRQAIPLQQLLSSHSDFFLPEANEKGLQLNRGQCKVAPETLFTDKYKLDSILTNLIKNAIKFTDKGSIEFGCSQKERNNLLFYVKDTGKGIQPDLISVIFERFRQGDISLTRGYEGSGLGLSISKAYVEALGGEIWVESEPGKGSCFYFTIPLTGSETEAAHPIETKNDDTRASRLPEKLRILIAEDDDCNFFYLEAILKPFNFTISRCVSGLEAVEYCRSHPETDLILMDIKMPEMDGCEATRCIREFNKDVVIVAQTAHALSGDRDKAIEAGCNDYIAKPINQHDLFTLIQTNLQGFS